MADFRVVALISAFNEADVISPVIGHLVENGVNVYLIDNRSTDGTAAAAKRWLRKGLLGIEQFPAEAPAGDGPPPFDWEAILKRKEALAKELSADWFIHHDADEFREALGTQRRFEVVVLAPLGRDKTVGGLVRVCLCLGHGHGATHFRPLCFTSPTD